MPHRSIARFSRALGCLLWPDEKANWPKLPPGLESDQRDYGIAITRDGERVDPNDFYAEPAE